MPRKVLILSLIFLLVLFVGVLAAEKQGQKNKIPDLETKLKPADESVSYPYSPRPEVKMFFPFSNDTIGYTYYDYQHNSGQRRMIAHDSLGNTHFTWMNSPDALLEDRYMDYNCRFPNGTWLAAGGMHVSDVSARGGYGGLDLLPNAREVLAYHQVQNKWNTVLAVETGDPGDGTFNIYDIPDSLAVGVDTAGIWPYIGIAKKKNGDTTYMHITCFSSNDHAGYVRCFQNPANPANLMCQSPGWASPITAPTTRLIPNKLIYVIPAVDQKIVYNSAPIATSPVSKRVAIAWNAQAIGQSYYKGDIYYVESNDNGNDWMTAGSMGTPIKLTNYDADNWATYTTFYTELAAVYDYNDSLHIFWTVSTAGKEGTEVTMFHWSKVTGIRKIITKANAAASGSAFNYVIAKPTVGVGCKVGHYAYNNLYVTYTAFADTDTSAAGYANGDIFKKASHDGGLTWGPEVNLTNTPSPRCAAGTCKSEHWASVAERVDDSMYVQYIYDRDAGGFIQTEGSCTNNPVRYFKEPAESVLAVPGKAYIPHDMITPPEWATNSGSTSDSMLFDNTGTADLYVKMSGPAYVTIAPNQFVIPKATSGLYVHLTFTAPHPDTFLVDSVKIESNDGVVGGGQVYTDIEWLKFHFVVTDTFYFAEYDTCTRGGVKLVVSNVGNLGNQTDSNMFNYSNHDYLFDFSSAFVTDYPGFGKLGSTWVHKHHNYLAQNHLIMINKDDLKTTVFCDYASPLPNTETYPWHHTWLGWIKYSTITQFEYGTLHAVIVKNIWKWKAPPKWWPDVVVTAPAGGYIGIVGDWDVPAEAARTNKGSLDSTRNLIWLKSDSTGFTNYRGGVLFLGASVTTGATTTNYTKPYGAHALMNRTTLYPHEGYDNDTLYKYMSMPGWSILATNQAGTLDSAQDLNIMMSIVNVPTPDISTTITVNYALLVTDQGQADFDSAAAKIARIKCGDANLDGKVSVSDVVYLINFLFKGGPAPWLLYADANGDCKISVSDVVYLINYLFKGGNPPHCADCLNCPSLP